MNSDPKNTLRIYPSGYLGSSLVAAFVPDTETITKQFMMISTTETFDKKDIVGSAEVIALINESQADRKNDFEFNQRVIECAIEAFGIIDLKEWIIKNYDSGLTYNHKLWIEETLAYIFEGKKRSCSNDSWGMLLTYKSNETGQDKKILPYTNQCLNQSNHQMLFIKNVIWEWCKQSGGIDDMLSSLFLLFGNH